MIKWFKNYWLYWSDPMKESVALAKKNMAEAEIDPFKIKMICYISLVVGLFIGLGLVALEALICMVLFNIIFAGICSVFFNILNPPLLTFIESYCIIFIINQFTVYKERKQLYEMKQKLVDMEILDENGRETR